MPEHPSATLGRPVFFDRQTLTRDNLNGILDYLRARMRRHNRMVVGSGVACGLGVARVPGRSWSVQVGAGLAVLPSGEEVEVPEGAPPFDIAAAAQSCLGIAVGCAAPQNLDAALAAEGQPYRSEDFSSLPGPVGRSPLDLGWATVSTPGRQMLAGQVGDLVGLLVQPSLTVTLAVPADRVEVRIAFGGLAPVAVARTAAGKEVDRQAPTRSGAGPHLLRLEGEGISEVTLEDASGETGLMSIALPATFRGEVVLALFAEETQAAFKPGLPERCRPIGDNVFPSRICEGYRLAVLCALPAGQEAPDCETIDTTICGPAHVPVPPIPGPGQDCIVLATLRCGEAGILAVDEFTHRRRLLPQRLLSDRAACDCAAPPPSEPPPTPPPSPPPPSPPPTEEPTEFTFFTVPSIFTRPTFFTQFTLFTDIGPDTLFTLPSFFPSLFTQFDPRDPFDPSGPVINVDPSGPVINIGVDEIAGVGNVLSRRLRDAGVTSGTEFVSRNSQELSGIMGVSEVRVAQMQLDARTKMRRGPG